MKIIKAFVDIGPNPRSYITYDDFVRYDPSNAQSFCLLVKHAPRRQKVKTRFENNVAYLRKITTESVRMPQSLDTKLKTGSRLERKFKEIR